MILLESCAFAHLPRTGGTFVHAMLEDKILGFCDHGFHDSLVLDLKLRGMPVYGFVRDPVTWYESWYALCVNGSEVYPAASQDPAILALGADKSIDEVVKALCCPTPEFKRAAYKMGILAHGGRLSANMLELLRRWQFNDLSFYGNMCAAYLGEGTRVLKFENIQDDLVKALDDNGLLTEALRSKILAAAPINFAARGAGATLADDTVALIKYVEHPLRVEYGYAA